MAAIKQTVAPTAEPLDIEEAKLHLRVTSDKENNLIAMLIKAARGAAESYTYRQLVTATFEWKLDRFPWNSEVLRPPSPPLITVGSITYVDQAGALQTFASSDYAVDTHSAPGRISLAHNVSWPDTRDIENSVTVTYNAGYGAASAVPEQITQGMLIALGNWFENRESTISGTIISKVPLSVESLWNPFCVPVVV